MGQELTTPEMAFQEQSESRPMRLQSGPSGLSHFPLQEGEIQLQNTFREIWFTFTLLVPRHRIHFEAWGCDCTVWKPQRHNCQVSSSAKRTLLAREGCLHLPALKPHALTIHFRHPVVGYLVLIRALHSNHTAKWCCLQTHLHLHQYAK